MSLHLKQKISPDYSQGVDRKQLRQIRDRFLKVNALRIERTFESLGNRNADILRILPLLYQVNHPLLPGYTSRETPRGISGFAPDKEVLSIAAGFSRTFRYRQDRRHRAQVHSIFIMGSPGTLAHSESSDVDVWLCVAPSLNREESQLIREKAEKIDQWANAEGLELHTFVMCADHFRDAQVVPEMDSESSGSAQHFLLLDEFYRTAILLAGRYPLWWLVPPAEELGYESITKLLLEKRFIKEAEVLDFGGMSEIPKSELIGAGLWQLYKSLESPYKSTLKLLLAEVYARELPEYPALSVEFKLAVYEDNLEIEQLDSYFLLYKRLENYLRRQQEAKRLQLIRKSFYLKVNKKLSHPVRARSSSWQRKFMQKQVAEWAWSKSELRHLDARFDWKVTDVLEERQELLAELTNAYRFLTNYARANAIGSSISQRDMSFLGRKLYAVFQRKAGKVERINLGIAPSMWEESLALHHASSQEFQTDRNAWLLYRNLASPSEAAFTQPLKKSSSLIELMAWLYFNGIITRASRLSVVPGESKIEMRDVLASLDVLEHSYPLPLPSVPQSAYQSAAKVQKILLLVNLGASPVDAEEEANTQRISDRTDSLSYSTQRVNLIKTIDQVVLNTWGEVSAVRYEVGETLLQNLQAYLQLCLSQAEIKPSLDVRCFSNFRSNAIEERILELFTEAYQVFFEGRLDQSANALSAPEPDSELDHLLELANEASQQATPTDQSFRYVLEIAESYYLIQKLDQQFRFERLDSRMDLMLKLQRTELNYQPIYLDSYALTQASMLRLSIAHNRKDSVQVFYRFGEEFTDLVVIDERGSVLETRLPKQEEVVFQSSIFSFLSTVVERRQLSMSDQGYVSMPSVVLYKVRDEDRHNVRAERVKRFDLIATEPVHALGVFDGDEIQFDLNVMARDFTHAEYGVRQLIALTRYYQSAAKRSNIPLKLHDVSFPADPMGVRRSGVQGFGTLDYLKVYVEFEHGLHEILGV